MKGFLADVVNALTSIKYTKVANRASVLRTSKKAAEGATRNTASGDLPVEPDTKTNHDAQEEADIIK